VRGVVDCEDRKWNQWGDNEFFSHQYLLCK
jgi:hypothetical protein